jgi:hypothetical protein
MGLVLKPRNSKSLSIKAGCTAVEEFRLGDYIMASIKDEPYMTFLMHDYLNGFYFVLCSDNHFGFFAFLDIFSSFFCFIAGILSDC